MEYEIRLDDGEVVMRVASCDECIWFRRNQRNEWCERTDRLTDGRTDTCTRFERKEKRHGK